MPDSAVHRLYSIRFSIYLKFLTFITLTLTFSSLIFPLLFVVTYICQDKSSLQGCQRMTGLRKEECTESVQLFSPLYTDGAQGRGNWTEVLSHSHDSIRPSLCNTRRINFFSSLTSLPCSGSFSGKVWTRSQEEPQLRWSMAIISSCLGHGL